MTYDVGNPGPGLRQEQQCGGVKLVNVYDTQPFVAISNKMIVNKIMLLMFKIKVHSRRRVRCFLFALI
jgi:hypothetical protein